MTIDFRSDTVTKPTKAMLDFMFTAALGDDVYGEDPTVNALEHHAAELFGFEAALFCTSGTQSNQIALKVHTVPGDEIICHEEAHIYRYEGGGTMINSNASVRFLRGNRGRIIPTELDDLINPDDVHFPVTKLVSIEDTANRGGGTIYDFNDIIAIRQFCNTNHLKLHLDGARVFNALTENKINYKTYGNQFDSISICLSKGLGAPVGSVLLGSKDFIKQARRVRKYMGGGMRQAGIVAAGGLYALKHHVERLSEDHRRAKLLGGILNQQDWVDHVLPIDTNIVVAVLKDTSAQSSIMNQLSGKGILSSAFGKGRIRMVTHLDIDDNDLDYIENTV